MYQRNKILKRETCLKTTRKDPHANQCVIAMSDVIIRRFWRHLVPLCSKILKENGIISKNTDQSGVSIIPNPTYICILFNNS